MTDGKHTPAPWVARGWFVDAKHRSIVTGVDCPGKDAENTANARLIAAAPELLEALMALWQQALQSELNSHSNEWGMEAIEMATAAIKKAKGES